MDPRPEAVARLAGKRALVTGAGRGIGASVARRLSAEGAAVAINYRSEQGPAEELAAELGGPGRAVALRGDVSDPAAGDDLVRQSAAALGGLDILVSNAGVEHFGALADTTLEDYQHVFGTNVAGQLFVTKAAAGAMGGGGRIVLTSSTSATEAVFEHSLYAASKAAVSALVRNLAPELAARGIAINAIAPGGTRTSMSAEHGRSYVPPALRDLPPDPVLRLKNSLARLAEPDEIAACVAFLVSDDASYVTGATLAVDGGRL